MNLGATSQAASARGAVCEPHPDVGARPAPSLTTLLLADLARKQRHYVMVDRFLNKTVKLLLQPGTIAVIVYRLGHWAATRRSRLWRRVAMFLYRLLEVPAAWMSGVSINPAVPIGPGFVIHNFSLVCIDAERIGENLTVNQGVSVGPDWRCSKRPIIGDNVYLGAGAAVLGEVEVGSNVVVAANCLVARSTASNCLVAGVPGLVVMRNLPDDYLRQVQAHAGKAASDRCTGQGARGQGA